MGRGEGALVDLRRLVDDQPLDGCHTSYEMGASHAESTEYKPRRGEHLQLGGRSEWGVGVHTSTTRASSHTMAGYLPVNTRIPFEAMNERRLLTLSTHTFHSHLEDILHL